MHEFTTRPKNKNLFEIANIKEKSEESKKVKYMLNNKEKRIKLKNENMANVKIKDRILYTYNY